MIDQISPEIRGFLYSSFITLVGIGIAWLRLRLKRGNVEVERDSVEVEQAAIVLARIRQLEAEKEAYKQELETQGALIVKYGAKHDKLMQQVAECHQNEIALKHAVDLAHARWQGVVEIAEKIVITTEIKERGKIEKREN